MDTTPTTPGDAPQSAASGNGLPFEPGAPSTAGPEASPPLRELQVAFRERFETLLPTLQREWPEVARHTLEATRGSFDHAVEVISRQTGLTSGGVRQQLQDLLQATGEQAHQVADTLRPLEDQLEQLLDDLNATLRPRIEKPVREKPLMALGIAAGVGLLLGMLLSGRRSA
jgi:ElaB/YqjD/DUF883 family membrane-anchored ribosome-binding protein